MTVSTGMRITILVDNKAGEGLVSKHCLSLWIETKNETLTEWKKAATDLLAMPFDEAAPHE